MPGSFSQHAAAFENAAPLVSHDAFAEYLDTIEALLATGASMAYQDSVIAATWMRRRRPLKGKRVPWAERVKLARRTRGHGRHLAQSLTEAAKQVRRMRQIHEEYVHKERDGK